MKKYFPRVFGNVQISDRIGTAIESGRMPHAFLILGPDGSGKHTLAKEIAAAVNCGRLGNSLPCGVCSACKRIYDGNFTDVKLLERPKDKATVGVNAIKDFREDMFLSATESDHKIYIIADAECMTVEAQNALLKILEEPPSGVIIILLSTEGDKILTTIKSRAQTVSMERFDQSELSRLASEISSDARELKHSSPEKFAAAIMGADGRLGEAIRLMDKRFSEGLEEERSVIERIVRALRRGTPRAELILATNALPQKRAELLSELELLTSAIRDMVAARRDGGVHLIFFSSREECLALAEAIGTKRLLDCADAVLEANGNLTKNANVTNIIASLTARLNSN